MKAAAIWKVIIQWVVSWLGWVAIVMLCIFKTRNHSLLEAVIFYHLFLCGGHHGRSQTFRNSKQIAKQILFCPLFLFTSLQKLVLSLLSCFSQSSVHRILLEADDTRSFKTYDWHIEKKLYAWLVKLNNLHDLWWTLHGTPAGVLS